MDKYICIKEFIYWTISIKINDIVLLDTKISTPNVKFIEFNKNIIALKDYDFKTFCKFK